MPQDIQHADMVSILDPMTPLRDPQGTLDTLRQGIMANGEALQAVNAGLLQLPVAAIADNKGALKKVNSRMVRTARGMISANNTTIGQVVQMLAGSVAGGLAGNAAALQTVQEIAATGGRIPTAPGGGGACGPGTYYLANFPPGSAGLGGKCGTIVILFQCSGTDGKPAWATRIYLAGGGMNQLEGGGNFDGAAQGDEAHTWTNGDYGAAVAWGQANFPMFAARCGGGAAPAPAAKWNIYYYCDPCADPAGVRNWQAGTFPANPGGQWILLSGAGINFPDQPTAQAALDSAESLLMQACQYAPGANADCGAPPAPSPTPTPTPPVSQDQCIPVPTCETASYEPPPEGERKSPAWYDQDWVYNRDAIIDDLVSFGDSVLSFMTGSLDQLTLAPTFKSTDSGDSPSWVAGTILSIASAFTAIPQAAIDAFKTLAGSMISTAQNVAAQFHSCDKRKVAKLCAGRAFVHLLTHFDPLDIVHFNIQIEPLDRYFEYAINAACFNKVPELGEIWESLKRGLTDKAQFYAVAAAHGLAIKDELNNDTALWGTYLAQSEWVEPWEYIQWARRREQNYSDDQISTDLQARYGFQVPDQAAKRIELSYELPTISDHLHWLQRNVFDAEYVQQYNLLDGFADDATIQALPGFAGYVQRFPLGRSNFWTEFGPDLHALGMRIEYAARHYAAHWVQPSMGQLGEMVCRLRPGRVDESIQFTPDDFIRLLGENDIAPFFRQRLLNILYRTFPLRQLNQAAQQGRFTYDDLYQRWQDLCFSPFDADIMAHTTLVQAARTSATQGKGWTPSTISALAEEGLIDFNTAVARLTPQGFTQDQVTDLFDVASLKKIAADRKRFGDKAQRDYATEALSALEQGYVDPGTASNALIAAGYPADAAALEIQTALLRAAAKATAQASAAIKRAFTRGDLDKAGAIAALESVGVQPGPAAQMVTIWALSITPRKRALSKGEAIKLYTEGVMTVTELETRLKNLGYSAHDMSMLIAEANANIARANALAESRSVAALARAERAAAAADAAILRGYCRLWPAGKLVKLFALRIIDESAISAKRAKCGDSSEAIADLIKQATVARDKLDIEAAKKGEAGIQYTGSDSISGGPTS